MELRGFLRPAEDIALYRAEMAAVAGAEPLRDWQMDIAEWVSANDECRLDILDQLESEAPAVGAPAAGLVRRAVAVDRLDQQQEHPADARLHGGPR